MRRKSRYVCKNCLVETARIEERSKRWRWSPEEPTCPQHLCVEVKDETVEPVWSEAVKVEGIQATKEEVPILSRQTLTINSLKGIKTTRAYKTSSRTSKTSLAMEVEIDDKLARALEEMEKTGRTWSLTITSEATQLEMVNTAPAETVSVPDDNHKGEAKEAAKMSQQGDTAKAAEVTGATA